MALNVSFDGYVFDSEGSLCNSNVYYQGYFYKNGTMSSESVWSDIRLIESSGYYSLNVGDSLWLTQDGTSLSGAIVLLVFWRGNTNRLADCEVLTEWGAFELILTGASFYSNNVQTKANILPTLSWSNNAPAHAYVNTFYSFYNSSTDTHSWTFGSITMHHWCTRYGETIFPINTITETDFDWGDLTSTLNLSGPVGYAHHWDTAGTYTVTMTVTDACGDSVYDTVDLDVYWTAPIPNIVRCNSIGAILTNTIETPDTPIYFKYTGTNIDSTIVSINWSITDTGSYGNTNTTYLSTNILDIVAHTEGLGTSWGGHSATSCAFTNPGAHTVTVTIIWNDGFQDQTLIYSEVFTQLKFDVPPVPNITCNESVSNHIINPSTVVTFNYSGTDLEDRITALDWTIYDSGAYGNTNSAVFGALKTDTIYHSNGFGAVWCGNESTSGAFTNPGNHIINVAVTWNDGWDYNVINYSESFIQDKFTGPLLNFVQVPDNAVIGQEVSFENTSTSVERVGLGLPDCEEYTWTWYDGSDIDVINDIQFTSILTKTSFSDECSVVLSADWSDGWETHSSHVFKDVVFGTVVTITPEDCYYVIDIVGTSTDGTVTDYGWTVSSGTSASGTFSLVWSSPIAVDQQNKTLCFSAIGWYKVEGTVYGTGYPTSDYKTLYVNETCPSEGTNIAIPIWDGTGILDVATDWVRIGYGYESIDSRHDGTHGLKVQAASILDDIIFHTTGYTVVDISDYAFLAFWINIRNWAQGADIIINMYSSTSSDHTALQLSNYVHFGLVGKWQRVMIPVLKFQLPIHDDMDGHPVYINTVKFSSLVGVDFWLDEVLITMGALVEQYLCGTYQNTFSATSEADVIGMTMAALNVPTSSVVNERALVPSFAIDSSIAWTKDVPPNMDNISVDNVGNYSNILDSLEDTSNVPDAVITSGKTHLSRGYPLPDLQPVIVSTKRVVDKKASLTPISTIKTYPLPLDTES